MYLCNRLINILHISIFTAAILTLAACQKEESTTETSTKSEQTQQHGNTEFKGKIAKKYEDSKEWWPEPVRPPKGAPNVIIFLLDDVGFAQIKSFGGLIETPNIDR